MKCYICHYVPWINKKLANELSSHGADGPPEGVDRCCALSQIICLPPTQFCPSENRHYRHNIVYSQLR